MCTIRRPLLEEDCVRKLSLGGGCEEPRHGPDVYCGLDRNHRPRRGCCDASRVVIVARTMTSNRSHRPGRSRRNVDLVVAIARAVYVDHVVIGARKR